MIEKIPGYRKDISRGEIMKNNIFIAAAICAVLSGITCIYAQEAPEDSPVVEVISVTGAAQVCVAGQTEYTDLQEGAFLKAGDKIKTNDNDSVELSFDEDNKNITRIEPGTETTLMLQDAEKLYILKGSVFSTIEELPAESSFEIKTPTAVVGVRGTDWATSVADEETTVEAVDGSPYVKGIDEKGALMAEEVTVFPGQMTNVRRFQKPGPLKLMASDKMAKWRETRAGLRQRAQQAIQKRPPSYKPRIRPINLKGQIKKGANMQIQQSGVDGSANNGQKPGGGAKRPMPVRPSRPAQRR